MSNDVPGAGSIRMRTTGARGARKCVYCQTAMAVSIMHNDAIPHGNNWRVIETVCGSSVESRDRDSAATGVGSALGHRRDEAVAAAVDRLDVARRLRVVAERLAQEADGFGERRVRDEGVLPDAVEELLPRHDLARRGRSAARGPRARAAAAAISVAAAPQQPAAGDRR